MNVVDTCIVLVLVLAVLVGRKRSFVKAAVAAVVMFGGVIVAALLYRWLAFLTESSERRALILVIFVLAISFLAYDISLFIGSRLEERLYKKHREVPLLEQVLGSILNIAAVLATVWILAAMFNNVPWAGVRRQLQASRVMQLLSSTARVPAGFLQIAHLTAPFSAPRTFTGGEPSFPATTVGVSESYDQLDSAASQAAAAVVKISSWGCGSTTVGSGFEVTGDRIVTNAHVVSGADRIIVQDSKGIYAARVVAFDATVDVAVLSVANKLSASPLTLSNGAASNGAIAAVLGYPSGKTLTIGDATIIQTLNAEGYDIYDQSKVTRNIYALRGMITAGSSGSALINAKGQVIGLVFGHSLSQNRTGYALTSKQITQTVENGKRATSTVANGSCLSH